MSDFDELSGIGNDVDREQVEEALNTLRRCMSLMETDRDELYDVIRVLEVLYDVEPDRPSTDEARIISEVLNNIEHEDVVSLEPSFVDDTIVKAMIQLRNAQKLESPE